ncbi:MAG: TRAP transporter small permease [Syntrophales bacterium]|jgi:TRAP-type C4-dicarboxylate transport system permease small subunit|nr:TRAP transporter small permease [Syntrophales bacterium]
MTRLDRALASASRSFNALACAALVAMMLLTFADVVLRLLRFPIPGTYELVGFLGAVGVSFALAYTSVERGHIAVDLIVRKLPKRMQLLIDGIGSIVSGCLFGLVTWQSFLYGLDLKKSGEVSLTLAMPLYPVLYGIAIGCALLCIVLLADGFQSLRRTTLS